MPYHSSLTINITRKVLLLIVFLLLLQGRLTNVSALGPNLIDNPSVEVESLANPLMPSNWVSDSWGALSVSHSYLTGGQNGARSISVTVSNFISGDAKWYFVPVQVKPSTSYTFTDYYKSTTSSQIMAQYTDLNGIVTYKWLATAPANSIWTKKSVKFTTPSNVARVSIFHLLNTNGTLTTDSFSLAETNGVIPTPTVTVSPTPTPTPTATPSPTPTITPSITLPPTVTPTVTLPPIQQNVIKNASVEVANPNNSNLPQYWRKVKDGANTSSLMYLTTGYTGTRSLQVKITKYTSGSAYFDFTPQPILPNTTYHFSVYYKTDVYTEVNAAVRLTDGSISYIYLGSQVPSTSWNLFEVDFKTPNNAKSISVYQAISTVGYLITDEYSLVRTSEPLPLNRGLVTLTFDDMYPTFNTYALPLFQKYNATGTLYITSQDFDQPGMMGKQELMDLYHYGFEIGSHSVTHPHLTQITQQEAENELRESRDSISSYFGGIPIRSFASPYGEYNQALLPIINKYYDTHRSTDVGFNAQNTTNRLNIRAQSVTSLTPISEVLGWVEEAMADKVWLVLVYHDVRPDDGSGFLWTTTPQDLESVLKNLHDNGIAAVTVSQAIDEITLGITPTSTPTLTPTPTPTFTPPLSPTPSPTIMPTTTPSITPVINLIPNSSVETVSLVNSTLPDQWIKEKGGTNNANFVYPGESHSGGKGLKVTATSFVSGSAAFQFNPVPVIPGREYEFSLYYKSTDYTELDGYIANIDGSENYMYLATLPASTTWTRYTQTIKIPANASALSIYLGLTSVGTLNTDDYSLTLLSDPLPLNRGIVSLTFDDGLLSHYQIVKPLLEEYGLRGTYYIDTAATGKAGRMSNTQYNDLNASGHEIGSHTAKHLHLTALSQSVLEDELTQSQNTLETSIGTPITSFATPFGEYNDNVVTTIQRFYSSHRSTDVGFNYKNRMNCYNILVQNVNLNVTPAMVKEWVDTAYRDKSWLVLVYHDIKNGGDAFSTTPANFTSEIQYIKQKEIAVKTVKEALVEISQQ